jgi:type II secretory ATPase GspE/PulE/Tfp pilus assembly ATPase PilB-like protein
LKFLSKEFVPPKMPKQYFTRKKIEQDIYELLNQSQLLIVYGPKVSGKTTTINKVLERRKGVIPVAYKKGTDLLVELGRILEIPSLF